MTAQSHRRPPKPWPMKWIVLAIALFVVGYTAVNIYFRKPGQAYRPYQDAQDRATTARLVAAGWQKQPAEIYRPTEPPVLLDKPAPVSRAAVGLGSAFEKNFAEQPKLMASVDRVDAPMSVFHGGNYVANFTASLTDLKAQVSDLTIYRHGNELVLVPTTEPLPGHDLMSRWNDSSYTVSFSTANLPPGHYSARIVARGPAAAWSFTIR